MDNLYQRKDREKKVFYRYERKTFGRNDFRIQENMLYVAHINCFVTKEEATDHYEASYKIASEKYEKIIQGIQKLKETLGDFSYEYFIEGDTHGIYEEGLYMEIMVNGYSFQFSQD